MKKFLSLVLALVMTMSLVTISAGAKEFKDASSITYEEAISVISDLKIVDGYADGEFKPTTLLNRGQAAKIICNLILGPTTASALHADAAPYSDVAADHQFAGYIAYCAQQGIISGYADGTFRPTANLTGYAFMKMLLGALGYDSEIEGYVGANWSVNVAKQALGIELDEGLKGDFNGITPVDRQTAALFVLNTLKSTMVDYDSKTTVNVNGATVTIGNSKAYELGNGAKTEGIKDDNKMQFAEKYFSDLKVEGAHDDFGRPANKWINDGTTIGTYAKTASVTYTKDVASKTVYKDLDLDSSDAYEFDIVVDGEDQAKVFTVAKKDEKTSLGDASKKLSKYVDDGAIVGNGSCIEVYNLKNEKVVVVINTYLMQVAGEYDSKNEELSLKAVSGDLNAPADPAVYKVSSDDVAGLDAFEDEDYVLVTVADGTIKSVKAAEMITATITEYVEKDTVTADGKDYSYAAASAKVNENEYELKEEYEIFVDENGYVLYVKGAEAADSSYVYVEGTYAVGYTGDAAAAYSKASKYAHVYFLDGTEDDITLNKVDGKTIHAGDAVANGWYKYSVKSTGKYDLKKVADTGLQTAADYVTNYKEMATSIGDSAKGNAKTKFIVVDKDGDVTIYTGIKNAPKTKGSYNVVKDGSYAKFVFISATDVEGGATSSDIIFILKLDKVGVDVDGDEYYRYKAIVNGSETKIKVDGLDLDKDTLQYKIQYSSKGYLSKAVAVDAAVADKEDDYIYGEGSSKGMTIKGQTLIVDGQEYYLNSACKIFLITDTDTVETVSTSKLVSSYKNKNAKLTLSGIVADHEITTLFVVVK